MEADAVGKTAGYSIMFVNLLHPADKTYLAEATEKLLMLT